MTSGFSLYFIIFVFQATAKLQGGSGQRLSCGYIREEFIRVCENTTVTCTCHANGTRSQTRWMFRNLDVCPVPFNPNMIILVQLPPCTSPTLGSSGDCGAYLRATNLDLSQSGACQDSMLTVTAHRSMHGLAIECRDMTGGWPGTVVGNTTMTIEGCPGPVWITSIKSDSSSMTVEWMRSKTGGGLPTSYVASITNTTESVTIQDIGSSVYAHTFTGLAASTWYTVSIMAINCAGNTTKTTDGFTTVDGRSIGDGAAISTSTVESEVLHSTSTVSSTIRPLSSTQGILPPLQSASHVSSTTWIFVITTFASSFALGALVTLLSVYSYRRLCVSRARTTTQRLPEPLYDDVYSCKNKNKFSVHAINPYVYALGENVAYGLSGTTEDGESTEI